MVWKDCGYFSLTKNGQKVSVVIKHVRYFLVLQVKDVLGGSRHYALVFEPLTKESAPM